MLKEQKVTIRNQVGKPTDIPRAKRVFFLFRRVRQFTLIVDKKKVEETDESLRGNP